MKIFNLGSCCIDHVYHVPDFVRPGETLPCTSYEIHPGGKGLNQSLAIAKAGMRVEHGGKIGQDGAWLKSLLNDAGVTTDKLLVTNEPSGHANIQVSSTGENAIVLFGGTNRQLTRPEVEHMLSSCEAGDFLVLQNEISELETAINIGAERELRMIFNAAPMTSAVLNLPLDRLELLIINETEGEALTEQNNPDGIISTLAAQRPSVNILLTLGAAGAWYAGREGRFSATPPKVDALDTTGAGDTFTGYFIAEYACGSDIQSALDLACRAAALSVTRAGAASSIPSRDELQA